VLLLVVYNAVVLPYEVAFLATRETPPAIDLLDDIADYSFMVDFVLTFFESFEDDRGEVVTELKLIRQNYMKFWFWIDLPASIPFDAFVPSDGSEGSSTNSLQYLGVVKCIRLLRIGRLLKYLEKFEYANVWNIVRLVCAFGLLAHWVGSAWYMIVSGDEDDEDTVEVLERHRWLSLDEIFNSTTLETVPDGETWIDINVPPNHDSGEVMIYLVMFYSALCMLLGENVGPFEPSQFILHACALLFGAIMQAYIFGQVALLISDNNSNAGRWKQKMNTVSSTMRGLELPNDLQNRIRNYYEYFWNRHRGINHALVFDDLSDPLLSEICLYLHVDHVKKVPFFKGCAPHFLVSIVKLLHPKIFLPGDYIVVKGQHGKEMYFIKNGKCKVVDGSGGSVGELNEGQSFGEMALYTENTKRLATVIAASYCDLDILSIEGLCCFHFFACNSLYITEERLVAYCFQILKNVSNYFLTWRQRSNRKRTRQQL
jgi:hypothetical protein